MSSEPTATLIDLKAAGLASAICTERFWQLGARTHSFESCSPVLGKVVDGWEDGAARGGRVVGGSGKVFGVAVLGTTPSPKL